MTDEERKTVVKALAMTAAYYRDQIPDHVLQMYVEDLEDQNPQAILQALTKYRRTSKTRRTPLPADLIELANPKAETKDEAVNVAVTIMRLASKNGRRWSDQYSELNAFWRAVADELGQTGLGVVEDLGGWTRTCEFIERADGHAFSQLRDMASFKLKSGLTDVRQPAIGGRPAVRLLDGRE